MPASRIPKYRLNRPSNRAVVTIDARDIYLGKYDSPESREKYDRLIAEWLAAGRLLRPPGASASEGITVAELILSFWRFAEGYYTKDGRPTSEVACIKSAASRLRRLYGSTPASHFGPMALKTVREGMVGEGLTRKTINHHVTRIRRIFRWGVENELVPPSVHQALSAVLGLRKGRTSARESEPVRPVPEEHVKAVLPHVSRQVRTMIELQVLTGARPGEVCQLKPADIDRSRDVWLFTPGRHKNEHRDQIREIFIGGRAQQILSPWLDRDPGSFLFRPDEAELERNLGRRAGRRSPMTPSQRLRNSRSDPKGGRNDHFTVSSYCRAVRRACAKAGIPRWHPHALRHGFATSVESRFGYEAARVLLGHASLDATNIYVQRDRARALAVAREIG